MMVKPVVMLLSWMVKRPYCASAKWLNLTYSFWLVVKRCSLIGFVDDCFRQWWLSVDLLLLRLNLELWFSLVG